MYLAAVAFGCLLLGQTPGGPLPAIPDQGPMPPAILQPTKPAEPVQHSLLRSPQTAEPADSADAAKKTSAEEAVPSEVPGTAQAKPSHRLHPPQIVAQSLTLPPGSAITGQPLALAAVLSGVQDRRQQLELTHAYWRLAEAVARYRFCFEENEQLGRLPSGGDEAVEMRAARASAAAALQEAEAGAVTAQHELAGLMALAVGMPPPLPADRPHVGLYHTYFNEMFGTGPGPDRTRLIDRVLPLRLAAIDAHALALQACEDSLAAAREAQAAGPGGLSLLVGCLDQHRRRQEEFMASVCRYNHDIADYALAVAPAGTGGEALAAMLIRPSREAVQPAVAAEPGGVVPASGTEPLPAPTQAPPRPNWPTRAVRPPPQATPDPQVPPPATSWAPAAPPSSGEPTLAPPHSLLRHNDQSTPTSPPPAEPAPPPTPPPTLTPTPTAQEVRKPIADVEPAPAAPAASAVYSALVHASDAGRAKQLALTLCWDRTLPAGTGQPMGLAECLRPVAAADRPAVIGAYWLSRQRAAQYQVLAQQGQWLDELTPLVLEHGPQAAVAMLQLRQQRLAGAAAGIEARAALMEAQFALAKAMGRAADPLWPLPSSLPHTDSNLEVHSGLVADTWALRGWKRTLPLLGRCIETRAAGVVETDAARAAATLGYQSGRQSLPQVLAAVEEQTSQTLAFLQTLTDYNQALAQYTVAVLPPSTPSDTLAAALLPPEG